MESDDLLAAEYVIGVLDGETRRSVAERIEREPAFARLVDGWAGRLAALDDGYQPVTPPAHLKAAIERRIGLTAPAFEGSRGWWSSLAVWRGAAIAALAAFAIAVAVPMLTAPPRDGQQYVAALQPMQGDMSFMAMYSAQDGMLTVKMMDGSQPTGNDLQLWLVEGDKPPMDMGVLPAGSSARMPVPMPMRPMLKPGIMLAVSIEPMGGSTTGAPTGPVIAMGDLRSI